MVDQLDTLKQRLAEQLSYETYPSKLDISNMNFRGTGLQKKKKNKKNKKKIEHTHSRLFHKI